jgi:hypothetical protein
MYVGAIIALNDELDPERFCKDAHQMRELMEKISEIADVEIRALNERTGEKVAELRSPEPRRNRRLRRNPAPGTMLRTQITTNPWTGGLHEFVNLLGGRPSANLLRYFAHDVFFL